MVSYNTELAGHEFLRGAVEKTEFRTDRKGLLPGWSRFLRVLKTAEKEQPKPEETPDPRCTYIVKRKLITPYGNVWGIPLISNILDEMPEPQQVKVPGLSIATSQDGWLVYDKHDGDIKRTKEAMGQATSGLPPYQYGHVGGFRVISTSLKHFVAIKLDAVGEHRFRTDRSNLLDGLDLAGRLECTIPHISLFKTTDREEAYAAADILNFAFDNYRGYIPVELGAPQLLLHHDKY